MWENILKNKRMNPNVVPYIDEIMSDGKWRNAAHIKDKLWEKLSNTKPKWAGTLGTRPTTIMPTSQELSQYLLRSGKYIKSRNTPREFKMPSKSQRVV